MNWKPRTRPEKRKAAFYSTDARRRRGKCQIPYICGMDASAPARQHAIPALDAQGLAKRYDARRALDGVDLCIAAGATFGLVGANGAGKPTFIKCALDQCAPDAGKVTLFGAPSSDPAARARLAYLPERFSPPHYLRGAEFLEMSAGLARARFSRARAERVAAELELDPAALDRPVRELSKCMTQKLGLAACFLAEKDLYLLDEPMSGLDPASRIAVKAILAPESRGPDAFLYLGRSGRCRRALQCDRGPRRRPHPLHGRAARAMRAPRRGQLGTRVSQVHPLRTRGSRGLEWRSPNCLSHHGARRC